MDLKLVREYMTSIGIGPGIVNVPADGCPECGARSSDPLDRKVVYVVVDHNSFGDEIYGLVPCPVCRSNGCEVCLDRGAITPTIRVGEPGFGEMQLCPRNCRAAQRLFEQRTLRLTMAAQLPEGYEDCSFETFETRLTDEERDGKLVGYWAVRLFVEAAGSGFWVDRRDLGAKFGRELLPDRRNWIVLHGAHGRGKTGLAAAGVNALTSNGVRAFYSRLQDVVKAVQDRFDDDWQEQGLDDPYGDATSGKVIELVRQAPVLFLDEFDVPDIKEHKRAVVENIIRYRSGRILPTIITTNLDEKGFELRWGPTIASVVKQRAHWIPVKGISLRPEPAEFDWE